MQEKELAFSVLPDFIPFFRNKTKFLCKLQILPQTQAFLNTMLKPGFLMPFLVEALARVWSKHKLFTQ